MPYITQEQRNSIDNLKIAYNGGDLNYQITMLLIEYLRNHGKRYQTINDIMGALEGAKLEFYRRVVAPYEDEKIEINGDVYV